MALVNVTVAGAHVPAGRTVTAVGDPVVVNTGGDLVVLSPGESFTAEVAADVFPCGHASAVSLDDYAEPEDPAAVYEREAQKRAEAKKAAAKPKKG